MTPQIYSCFREAREALTEIEVFSHRTPVRVLGKLADDKKGRRFVQIGRGVIPTTPPQRVDIVGIGGKEVATLSPTEVIPLSF